MVPVKPPRAAQRLAARALEIRASLPKSRRAGLTEQDASSRGIISGVERAKSIAKGETQPDAERIVAFFDRFRGMITRAVVEGKGPRTSKAIQAGWLWGGATMEIAARSAVEKAKGKR